MTEIPMIFWVSKEFIVKYPNKLKNFKNNQNKVFTNDLIFESLLGLFGINEKSLEDNKNNLFSATYYLDPEKAQTLHGKKFIFSDRSNFRFVQKENADIVINEKIETKILPHRVNSVGKLNDILNNGLHNFELDLHYSYDERNCFNVGHGPEPDMSELCLSDFLKVLKDKNIKPQKIWLDIKNFNIGNHVSLIKRLEYLNRKYDIRNYAIFETSYEGSEVAKVSDLGYHTSYYLPTGYLKELNKSKEPQKINSFLTRLKKIVKNQKLKAISFEDTLYGFVKSEIEENIDSEIIYHLWTWENAFYTKDFTKIKKSRNYYKDSRVETILMTFDSRFLL